MRMADIDDVSRLVASDIYYHPKCMSRYMGRYTRRQLCLVCKIPASRNEYSLDEVTFQKIMSTSLEIDDHMMKTKIRAYYDDQKKEFLAPCFAHPGCVASYTGKIPKARKDIYSLYLKPLIDDMLARGYGLELSDLRDHLSDKLPYMSFYNHKIKEYIALEYNQPEPKVSFCNPFRKNQSEVAYPSWISEAEMAAKLQTLDVISDAGKALRSELRREVDFHLDDSFCDV